MSTTLADSAITSLTAPQQGKSGLTRSFTYVPNGQLYWIRVVGLSVTLLDETLSLVATFEPFANIEQFQQIDQTLTQDHTITAVSVCAPISRIALSLGSFAYVFRLSHSITDRNEKPSSSCTHSKACYRFRLRLESCALVPYPNYFPEVGGSNRICVPAEIPNDRALAVPQDNRADKNSTSIGQEERTCNLTSQHILALEWAVVPNVAAATLAFEELVEELASEQQRINQLLDDIPGLSNPRLAQKYLRKNQGNVSVSHLDTAVEDVESTLENARQNGEGTSTRTNDASNTFEFIAPYIMHLVVVTKGHIFTYVYEKKALYPDYVMASHLPLDPIRSSSLSSLITSISPRGSWLALALPDSDEVILHRLRRPCFASHALSFYHSPSTSFATIPEDTASPALAVDLIASTGRKALFPTPLFGGVRSSDKSNAKLSTIQLRVVFEVLLAQPVILKHPAAVFSVSFNPQPRHQADVLLTLAMDGTARLWSQIALPATSGKPASPMGSGIDASSWQELTGTGGTAFGLGATPRPLVDTQACVAALLSSVRDSSFQLMLPPSTSEAQSRCQPVTFTASSSSATWRPVARGCIWSMATSTARKGVTNTKEPSLIEVPAVYCVHLIDPAFSLYVIPDTNEVVVLPAPAAGVNMQPHTHSLVGPLEGRMPYLLPPFATFAPKSRTDDEREEEKDARTPTEVLPRDVISLARALRLESLPNDFSDVLQALKDPAAWQQALALATQALCGTDSGYAGNANAESKLWTVLLEQRGSSRHGSSVPHGSSSTTTTPHATPAAASAAASTSSGIRQLRSLYSQAVENPQITAATEAEVISARSTSGMPTFGVPIQRLVPVEQGAPGDIIPSATLAVLPYPAESTVASLAALREGANMCLAGTRNAQATFVQNSMPITLAKAVKEAGKHAVGRAAHFFEKTLQRRKGNEHAIEGDDENGDNCALQELANQQPVLQPTTVALTSVAWARNATLAVHGTESNGILSKSALSALAHRSTQHSPTVSPLVSPPIQGDSTASDTGAPNTVASEAKVREQTKENAFGFGVGALSSSAKMVKTPWICDAHQNSSESESEEDIAVLLKSQSSPGLPSPTVQPVTNKKAQLYSRISPREKRQRQKHLALAEHLYSIAFPPSVLSDQGGMRKDSLRTIVAAAGATTAAAASMSQHHPAHINPSQAEAIAVTISTPPDSLKTSCHRIVATDAKGSLICWHINGLAEATREGPGQQPVAESLFHLGRSPLATSFARAEAVCYSLPSPADAVDTQEENDAPFVVDFCLIPFASSGSLYRYTCTRYPHLRDWRAEGQLMFAVGGHLAVPPSFGVPPVEHSRKGTYASREVQESTRLTIRDAKAEYVRNQLASIRQAFELPDYERLSQLGFRLSSVAQTAYKTLLQNLVTIPRSLLVRAIRNTLPLPWEAGYHLVYRPDLHEEAGRAYTPTLPAWAAVVSKYALLSKRPTLSGSSTPGRATPTSQSLISDLVAAIHTRNSEAQNSPAWSPQVEESDASSVFQADQASIDSMIAKAMDTMALKSPLPKTAVHPTLPLSATLGQDGQILVWTQIGSEGIDVAAPRASSMLLHSNVLNSAFVPVPQYASNSSLSSNPYPRYEQIAFGPSIDPEVITMFAVGYGPVAPARILAPAPLGGATLIVPPCGTKTREGGPPSGATIHGSVVGIPGNGYVASQGMTATSAHFVPLDGSEGPKQRSMVGDAPEPVPHGWVLDAYVFNSSEPNATWMLSGRIVLPVSDRYSTLEKRHLEQLDSGPAARVAYAEANSYWIDFPLNLQVFSDSSLPNNSSSKSSQQPQTTLATHRFLVAVAMASQVVLYSIGSAFSLSTASTAVPPISSKEDLGAAHMSRLRGATLNLLYQRAPNQFEWDEAIAPGPFLDPEEEEDSLADAGMDPDFEREEALVNAYEEDEDNVLVANSFDIYNDLRNVSKTTKACLADRISDSLYAEDVVSYTVDWPDAQLIQRVAAPRSLRRAALRSRSALARQRALALAMESPDTPIACQKAKCAVTSPWWITAASQLSTSLTAAAFLPPTPADITYSEGGYKGGVMALLGNREGVLHVVELPLSPKSAPNILTAVRAGLPSAPVSRACDVLSSVLVASLESRQGICCKTCARKAFLALESARWNPIVEISAISLLFIATLTRMDNRLTIFEAASGGASLKPEFSLILTNSLRDPKDLAEVVQSIPAAQTTQQQAKPVVQAKTTKPKQTSLFMRSTTISGGRWAGGTTSSSSSVAPIQPTGASQISPRDGHAGAASSSDTALTELVKEVANAAISAAMLAVSAPPWFALCDGGNGSIHLITCSPIPGHVDIYTQLGQSVALAPSPTGDSLGRHLVAPSTYLAALAPATSYYLEGGIRYIPDAGAFVRVTPALSPRRQLSQLDQTYSDAHDASFSDPFAALSHKFSSYFDSSSRAHKMASALRTTWALVRATRVAPNGWHVGLLRQAATARICLTLCPALPIDSLLNALASPRLIATLVRALKESNNDAAPTTSYPTSVLSKAEGLWRLVAAAEITTRYHRISANAVSAKVLPLGALLPQLPQSWEGTATVMVNSIPVQASASSGSAGSTSSQSQTAIAVAVATAAAAAAAAASAAALPPYHPTALLEDIRCGRLARVRTTLAFLHKELIKLTGGISYALGEMADVDDQSESTALVAKSELEKNGPKEPVFKFTFTGVNDPETLRRERERLREERRRQLETQRRSSPGLMSLLTTIDDQARAEAATRLLGQTGSSLYYTSPLAGGLANGLPVTRPSSRFAYPFALYQSYREISRAVLGRTRARTLWRRAVTGSERYADTFSSALTFNAGNIRASAMAAADNEGRTDVASPVPLRSGPLAAEVLIDDLELAADDEEEELESYALEDLEVDSAELELDAEDDKGDSSPDEDEKQTSALANTDDETPVSLEKLQERMNRETISRKKLRRRRNLLREKRSHHYLQPSVLRTLTASASIALPMIPALVPLDVASGETIDTEDLKRFVRADRARKQMLREAAIAQQARMKKQAQQKAKVTIDGVRSMVPEEEEEDGFGIEDIRGQYEAQTSKQPQKPSQGHTSDEDNWGIEDVRSMVSPVSSTRHTAAQPAISNNDSDEENNFGIEDVRAMAVPSGTTKPATTQSLVVHRQQSLAYQNDSDEEGGFGIEDVRSTFSSQTIPRNQTRQPRQATSAVGGDSSEEEGFGITDVRTQGTQPSANPRPVPQPSAFDSDEDGFGIEDVRSMPPSTAPTSAMQQGAFDSDDEETGFGIEDVRNTTISTPQNKPSQQIKKAPVTTTTKLVHQPEEEEPQLIIPEVAPPQSCAAGAASGAALSLPLLVSQAEEIADITHGFKVLSPGEREAMQAASEAHRKRRSQQKTAADKAREKLGFAGDHSSRSRLGPRSRQDFTIPNMNPAASASEATALAVAERILADDATGDKAAVAHSVSSLRQMAMAAAERRLKRSPRIARLPFLTAPMTWLVSVIARAVASVDISLEATLDPLAIRYLIAQRAFVIAHAEHPRTNAFKLAQQWAAAGTVPQVTPGTGTALGGTAGAIAGSTSASSALAAAHGGAAAGVSIGLGMPGAATTGPRTAAWDSLSQILSPHRVSHIAVTHALHSATVDKLLAAVFAPAPQLKIRGRVRDPVLRLEQLRAGEYVPKPKMPGEPVDDSDDEFDDDEDDEGPKSSDSNAGTGSSSGTAAPGGPKIRLVPGAPISWMAIARYGLGYVLLTRPESELRQWMTSVARMQFHFSQNPSDCLLWYLALGQKQELLNVLAGFPDMAQARKFFQKDFTHEANRQSAKAAAFNALSKNKFLVAVAFFILAEEIEAACRICYRNLADWQLALVIARLTQGEDSPTFKKLLEEDMLPEAARCGDPWLKHICLLLLKRPYALASLMEPVVPLAASGFAPASRTGSDSASPTVPTPAFHPAVTGLFLALDASKEPVHLKYRVKPAVLAALARASSIKYHRWGCSLLAAELEQGVARGIELQRMALIKAREDLKAVSLDEDDLEGGDNVDPYAEFVAEDEAFEELVRKTYQEDALALEHGVTLAAVLNHTSRAFLDDYDERSEANMFKNPLPAPDEDDMYAWLGSNIRDTGSRMLDQYHRFISRLKKRRSKEDKWEAQERLDARAKRTADHSPVANGLWSSYYTDASELSQRKKRLEGCVASAFLSRALCAVLARWALYRPRGDSESSILSLAHNMSTRAPESTASVMPTVLQRAKNVLFTASNAITSQPDPEGVYRKVLAKLLLSGEFDADASVDLVSSTIRFGVSPEVALASVSKFLASHMLPGQFFRFHIDVAPMAIHATKPLLQDVANEPASSSSLSTSGDPAALNFALSYVPAALAVPRAILCQRAGVARLQQSILSEITALANELRTKGDGHITNSPGQWLQLSSIASAVREWHREALAPYFRTAVRKLAYRAARGQLPTPNDGSVGVSITGDWLLSLADLAPDLGDSYLRAILNAARDGSEATKSNGSVSDPEAELKLRKRLATERTACARALALRSGMSISSIESIDDNLWAAAAAAHTAELAVTAIAASNAANPLTLTPEVPSTASAGVTSGPPLTNAEADALYRHVAVRVAVAQLDTRARPFFSLILLLADVSHFLWSLSAGNFAGVRRLLEGRLPALLLNVPLPPPDVAVATASAMTVVEKDAAVGGPITGQRLPMLGLDFAWQRAMAVAQLRKSRGFSYEPVGTKGSSMSASTGSVANVSEALAATELFSSAWAAWLSACPTTIAAAGTSRLLNPALMRALAAEAISPMCSPLTMDAADTQEQDSYQSEMDAMIARRRKFLAERAGSLTSTDSASWTSLGLGADGTGDGTGKVITNAAANIIASLASGQPAPGASFGSTTSASSEGQQSETPRPLGANDTQSESQSSEAATVSKEPLTGPEISALLSQIVTRLTKRSHSLSVLIFQLHALRSLDRMLERDYGEHGPCNAERLFDDHTLVSLAEELVKQSAFTSSDEDTYTVLMNRTGSNQQYDAAAVHATAMQLGHLRELSRRATSNLRRALRYAIERLTSTIEADFRSFLSEALEEKSRHEHRQQAAVAAAAIARAKAVVASAASPTSLRGSGRGSSPDGGEMHDDQTSPGGLSDKTQSDTISEGSSQMCDDAKREDAASDRSESPETQEPEDEDERDESDDDDAFGSTQFNAYGMNAVLSSQGESRRGYNRGIAGGDVRESPHGENSDDLDEELDSVLNASAAAEPGFVEPFPVWQILQPLIQCPHPFIDAIALWTAWHCEAHLLPTVLAAAYALGVRTHELPSYLHRPLALAPPPVNRAFPVPIRRFAVSVSMVRPLIPIPGHPSQSLFEQRLALWTEFHRLQDAIQQAFSNAGVAGLVAKPGILASRGSRPSGSTRRKRGTDDRPSPTSPSASQSSSFGPVYGFGYTTRDGPVFGYNSAAAAAAAKKEKARQDLKRVRSQVSGVRIPEWSGLSASGMRTRLGLVLYPPGASLGAGAIACMFAPAPEIANLTDVLAIANRAAAAAAHAAEVPLELASHSRSLAFALGGEPFQLLLGHLKQVTALSECQARVDVKNAGGKSASDLLAPRVLATGSPVPSLSEAVAARWMRITQIAVGFQRIILPRAVSLLKSTSASLEILEETTTSSPAHRVFAGGFASPAELPIGSPTAASQSPIQTQPTRKVGKASLAITENDPHYNTMTAVSTAMKAMASLALHTGAHLSVFLPPEATSPPSQLLRTVPSVLMHAPLAIYRGEAALELPRGIAVSGFDPRIAIVGTYGGPREINVSGVLALRAHFARGLPLGGALGAALGLLPQVTNTSSSNSSNSGKAKSNATSRAGGTSLLSPSTSSSLLAFRATSTSVGDLPCAGLEGIGGDMVFAEAWLETRWLQGLSKVEERERVFGSQTRLYVTDEGVIFAPPSVQLARALSVIHRDDVLPPSVPYSIAALSPRTVLSSGLVSGYSGAGLPSNYMFNCLVSLLQPFPAATDLKHPYGAFAIPAFTRMQVLLADTGLGVGAAQSPSVASQAPQAVSSSSGTPYSVVPSNQHGGAPTSTPIPTPSTGMSGAPAASANVPAGAGTGNNSTLSAPIASAIAAAAAATAAGSGAGLGSFSAGVAAAATASAIASWLAQLPIVRDLRMRPVTAIAAHPTLPFYVTASVGVIPTVTGTVASNTQNTLLRPIILLWHQHNLAPMAVFSFARRPLFLDRAFGFAQSLATASSQADGAGVPGVRLSTLEAGFAPSVSTGDEVHAAHHSHIIGPKDRIVRLRFSEDGSRLVAISLKGIAAVWAFEPEPSATSTVALSTLVGAAPGTSSILGASPTGPLTVQVVSASHLWMCHDIAGADACFLGSSTLLATCGESQDCRNVALWDLTRMSQTHQSYASFEVHCPKLAFLSVPGVYLPSPPTGTPAQTGDFNGCSSIVYVPTSNTLVCGGARGRLCSIDLKTLKIRSMRAHYPFSREVAAGGDTPVPPFPYVHMGGIRSKAAITSLAYLASIDVVFAGDSQGNVFAVHPDSLAKCAEWIGLTQSVNPLLTPMLDALVTSSGSMLDPPPTLPNLENGPKNLNDAATVYAAEGYYVPIGNNPAGPGTSSTQLLASLMESFYEHPRTGVIDITTGDSFVLVSTSDGVVRMIGTTIDSATALAMSQ